MDSVSSIDAEFAYGKDINSALVEVINELKKVSLPPGAYPPFVFKKDSSTPPVIVLAVAPKKNSNLSLADIRELAENQLKDELLKLLKERLGLERLRVVSPKQKITSIALTTGAGASLMDEVDADCFLTGDIKYHDAMKAMSENLMMVDIGHYESEKFFAEILLEELKVLPILAIIANSKNPFHMGTL